MSDSYQPTPEDRFTFGLWTVGNRGRDPFGLPTRPEIEPAEITTRLAEAGAWGVNLHDEDLIPFGVPAAERDRIVSEFKTAVDGAGLVVPMVTVNLFSQPVFKDGAFTAADPAVRRLALRKTIESMDLAAELGANIFVLWGGREGFDTGAARDPVAALERYREAIDFLCAYITDQGLDLKIALEPKPNEPRGHILFPTIGHMLHLIERLEHSELVGVNPEMAHEAMAGLSFHQAVAQSIWAGRLLHVDLNAQYGPRYDQDLRFGSEDIKEAFLTVKVLEESGFSGPLHFDCRAYRTEDDAGVFSWFATGCMRNYKILKAKVKAFQEDEEIQEACKAAGLLEIKEPSPSFTPDVVQGLLDEDFTELVASEAGRGHERADQLMMELIYGVR